MKVGIIGYKGDVAQRHIKAWEELGIEWIGCEKENNWREFIERKDLDLIDICTPIYLHPSMFIGALRARKDVLCEKPIANNLSEAYKMASYAENSKNRAGIIYQYRFNPKFLKLKREIEKGKFGEIKMAVVNYFRYKDLSYFAKKWRGCSEQAGGGVVLNVTIHYLDQLQWLFGYPKSIKGFVTTAKTGIDVEDTATAIMKFPNGTIGSVSLSTHVTPPKHMEFSVFGTKGYKTIQMRENEYHKENFEAFLKGENYVTPLEAIKSLKMALTIIGRR